MTVFHRDETQLPCLDTQLPQKQGQCRANGTERPVLYLQRDPEPVGRTRTKEPFGATLCDPPSDLSEEHYVRRDRTSQHLRVGTDGGDYARPTLERAEPAESMRATIERERERRDATTVDRDRER